MKNYANKIFTVVMMLLVSTASFAFSSAGMIRTLTSSVDAYTTVSSHSSEASIWIRAIVDVAITVDGPGGSLIIVAEDDDDCWRSGTNPIIRMALALVSNPDPGCKFLWSRSRIGPRRWIGECLGRVHIRRNTLYFSSTQWHTNVRIVGRAERKTVLHISLTHSFSDL